MNGNSLGLKLALSLLLGALLAYTGYTLYRVVQAGLPVPETPGLDGFAVSAAGQLADLEFRDQDDRPFRFDSLEGEVWIGSMFFSTCPHHCRRLNLVIKDLAEDEAFADVRFVSMTVDPQTDTPDTLREYAERFEADTDRWTFLTGRMTDIAMFGTQILRVPTSEKVHTERLVLVDGGGTLRGAFLFSDTEELARLRRFVIRLAGDEAVDGSESVDDDAETVARLENAP